MKKVCGLLTLVGVFFFAAGAWALPNPKSVGGDGKVGQVGSHDFSKTSKANSPTGGVRAGNYAGKPRA